MREVEKYLDILKVEKKYSEHTIKSYHEDLEEYFNFLDREKIAYQKVTYDNVRNFLKELNDKDNSSRTVSRKISSLRGFYKYLTKQKRLKTIPLH